MIDMMSSSPAAMSLVNQGSNPYEILITALDQDSGTDVLSSPRITTRSGEEATIRVGERHYYPEVFEGIDSQGTILCVEYADFEEKMLGVNLTVTPEIDGNQISLALNPTVTELSGWRSYTLAEANSQYNYRLQYNGNAYEHDAIIGRLPIFKKRMIETEVTIADGGTVGMGGLMHEKTESFEDKVPVLGSIPLLGRLFRHEGERSVKRNLLMFVTAKKVSPSGHVIVSSTFE